MGNEITVDKEYYEKLVDTAKDHIEFVNWKISQNSQMLEIIDRSIGDKQIKKEVKEEIKQDIFDKILGSIGLYRKKKLLGN